MEDNRKRNMDRRRETSRYAARDRRGKEADIFNDLKDVVPIVEDGTVTHLDRIALLRVAATVCRLRKTAGNVLETTLGEETVSTWSEDMLSECLDGFLLIADSDSYILYITESVALYLGLTQTDLTGRSLKEFLHPTDYDEFVKLAGELNGNEENETKVVNTVLRMKTVISPRGRCLNLKSALFKPVTFVVRGKASTGGHVLLMQGATIPAGQGSINANATALTKFTELSTGMFMTRHTCDMRISYVSDRFNYVLKSELKNLLGSSYYELVHPADVKLFATAMKELFAKGHTRTPYYRLLAASDTFVWVQTEATTISHTTKGQKGQYVICVHHVLGMQEEFESVIICGESMPAGISVRVKKEIDDGAEYIGRQPEIIECVDFTPLVGLDDVFDLEPIPLAKSSTDDSATRAEGVDGALHWLFRANPSGPAPGFGRHDDFRRLPPSTLDDPSLASAQLVDASRSPSEERLVAVAAAAGRPDSNGQLYSPLADGFLQFGIRSPEGVQPAAGQHRDARPLAGRDAGYPPRRIPALQAPDSLAVPTGCVGGANGPSAYLLAPLPAADSQSCANGPVDAQMTPTFAEPLICKDLQWEEPDLSGLAPFIDYAEMEPIGNGDLGPELQSLLFDDFAEWQPQPRVPAAVPVYLPRGDSRSPPTKRMVDPKGEYFDDQEYGDCGQQQYWTGQKQVQDPYWPPFEPQQQQQQQQQFANTNEYPRYS